MRAATLAALAALAVLGVTSAARADRVVAVEPQLGHADVVTEVALSPDGAFAATSSDDAVIVWDTGTGMQRKLHAGRTGAFTRTPLVQFSGDGKLLLVVTSATAIAYRVGSFEPAWSLPVRTGSSDIEPVTYSLQVSDDAERFAYYLRKPDKSGVIVWSRQSIEKVLTVDAELTSIALSPAGDRAVGGTKGGDVIVWDVKTGKPTASRRFDEDVDHVAFVRDTTYVLVGASPYVALWDPGANEILAVNAVPANRILAVRAAPTSSTIQVTGAVPHEDGWVFAAWTLDGTVTGRPRPWGPPREQARLPKTPGRAMRVASATRAPLVLAIADNRASLIQAKDGLVQQRLALGRVQAAPTAIGVQAALWRPSDVRSRMGIQE